MSEIYKVPPTTLQLQDHTRAELPPEDDTICLEDEAPTVVYRPPPSSVRLPTTRPALPPSQECHVNAEPLPDAENNTITQPAHGDTAPASALPTIAEDQPAATPPPTPAATIPLPPTPPEVLTRPEQPIVHQEEEPRRSRRNRRLPARLRDDYDLSS